ncbi:MFS transporter [Jatrophihabitans sp. GAS493]|uniref:MFS transporter n=1 Tax=Jatrophihabitans sp. GAS493 TaxID=1907575 RepID=UPI000BB867E2|nr:MFS transporter [Jatrophihabitans sp. GAS493]SOD74702.1 MFS transporter [Jatrophihabitans sp. GAS493]
MLDNYRTVFRTPGSAAFCAAAFVMRSAIALYPLGLVLLISLRTGHYSFAGLLSGIYVISSGAGNPVLGRYVDRYGQTRLLLPFTAIHVAAIGTMALLAELNAPDWTLIPPTAIGGFFYLAVGSLVRARWSYVLKNQAELTTAYSLEATLDELIFVLGPVIATVIATQLDPTLVPVLGCLVVGGGAIWLSRLTGSAPPPHPQGSERTRSALRFRGVPLVFAAMICTGGFFASAEITIIAFCGERGSAGVSGAVLACLSLGSASSGFVYGARHWGPPLLQRFWWQSILFGSMPVLLLFATTIPMLALISFVVGLATAPLLITAFGLVERIVPDRVLTEGMAWMTTGLSLGYGLFAGVVGRIADTHGARPAFSVAIACGLVEAVAAFAVYSMLRGAPLPGDAADAAALPT